MGEDDSKGKLYFCHQNEDGEWGLLGEIGVMSDEEITETYGMDTSNSGLSFDGETVEMSLDMKVSGAFFFYIFGIRVTNIIYCKDCKHCKKLNGDDCYCERLGNIIYHYVEPNDFCSHGEKGE